MSSEFPISNLIPAGHHSMTGLGRMEFHSIRKIHLFFWGSAKADGWMPLTQNKTLHVISMLPGRYAGPVREGGGILCTHPLEYSTLLPWLPNRLTNSRATAVTPARLKPESCRAPAECLCNPLLPALFHVGMWPCGEWHLVQIADYSCLSLLGDW